MSSGVTFGQHDCMYILGDGAEKITAAGGKVGMPDADGMNWSLGVWASDIYSSSQHELASL